MHVGFGATYEPGAKHEDVLRRGEMPAADEIVGCRDGPPSAAHPNQNR
jgi:hypothetical protein